MADSLTADMRAGLEVDGGSDLKMILSYVDALPTGYSLETETVLCCFFSLIEKIETLISFDLINFVKK